MNPEPSRPPASDVGAVFNIDGKQFHLLGYTDEGFNHHAAITDGDKVFPATGDDGGRWVARCKDCPTTWVADYGYHKPAEWEFTGDGAYELAEAFSKRHNSLQGHVVQVLKVTTFTFRTRPDAPQYVDDDALLGQGDAGDLGSVGKL